MSSYVYFYNIPNAVYVGRYNANMVTVSGSIFKIAVKAPDTQNLTFIGSSSSKKVYVTTAWITDSKGNKINLWGTNTGYSAATLVGPDQRLAKSSTIPKGQTAAIYIQVGEFVPYYLNDSAYIYYVSADFKSDGRTYRMFINSKGEWSVVKVK